MPTYNGRKRLRLINEDDLPDNVTRIAMYQAAAEKLKQEGFVSIGLDHFAKSSDVMTEALKNKKTKTEIFKDTAPTLQTV